MLWRTTNSQICTNSQVCMCPKSLQSCPTLWNPMDCTPPGSSVQGFSRQEYGRGLPCPPPGDLPHPGTERTSPVVPALPADSLPLIHWWSPMHRHLILFPQFPGASHHPVWIIRNTYKSNCKRYKQQFLKKLLNQSDTFSFTYFPQNAKQLNFL